MTMAEEDPGGSRRRGVQEDSPVPGVVLTGVLHFLVILGLLVADPLFSHSAGELFRPWQFFALLLGVTQLFYMLPLGIYVAARRKKALLKGLVIGAAATFILNALCYGVLMLN
jgi:hypothetical protein